MILFLAEMEGLGVYILSTELKGRFPMIWTGVDNDRNVSHHHRDEPRCEKTGLRGFRPGPTQTGL